MTSPQLLVKRVLHRMGSSGSSFIFQFPLRSLRSSNSCLRLLPRLLVTSSCYLLFNGVFQNAATTQNVSNPVSLVYFFSMKWRRTRVCKMGRVKSQKRGLCSCAVCWSVSLCTQLLYGRKLSTFRSILQTVSSECLNAEKSGKGIRLRYCDSTVTNEAVESGLLSWQALVPSVKVTLSQAVKRPRREADHRHQSNDNNKNEWRNKTCPPIRLHDLQKDPNLNSSVKRIFLQYKCLRPLFFWDVTRRRVVVLSVTIYQRASFNIPEE